MDKIKEYLPVLSVLAIGLGFARMQAYYSYFNIRIIDYLQLSEILTNFISHLVPLSIYYILGFGLDLLVSLFRRQGSENLNSYKIEELPKWIGIIVGLHVFIFLLSYSSNSNYELFYEDLKFLPISAAFFILIIILINVKPDKNLHPLHFIFTLIFLYFFMIREGRVEAISKKDTLKNEVYKLVLNDTILTTNDKITYVGKTESFLFLYNDSLKSTSVYRTENIKEMTLAKKIEKPTNK